VHAEHDPGPRLPLVQAPLLLGHVHAPLMQSGVAPVHAEQDPGGPQEPTVLSHTHWACASTVDAYLVWKAFYVTPSTVVDIVLRAYVYAMTNS
jgi:hypothetical protein